MVSIGEEVFPDIEGEADDSTFEIGLRHVTSPTDTAVARHRPSAARP